jgi:hypothetical protein
MTIESLDNSRCSNREKTDKVPDKTGKAAEHASSEYAAVIAHVLASVNNLRPIFIDMVQAVRSQLT